MVDSLPTAVNRPSLLCRESTACPVCREARRHAPHGPGPRQAQRLEDGILRWEFMGLKRADAGASEGRLVAPSSQPIPTAPSTESAPFFTAEHPRSPVRRWRVEGRHALRADTMPPNGDDCAMRAWSPALACSKVAPVTLRAASLTRESSR